MKSIEIDWKKVYEVNPEGLMEYVGTLEMTIYKPLKIEERRESFYVTSSDNGYSIYYSSLNKLALDLIYWLGQKGLYVYVIPLSLRHKVIFRWDILESKSGNIDYSTNNEALAAGILKAFEVLKT